jgi:hypothetical protein
MNISIPHKRFSDILKDPKALTNPEDYLGPNWKAVINLWLYLDTLSEDERKKMSDRYWDLDEDMRLPAGDSANATAIKVVGWKVEYAAWRAVLNVTDWCIFAFATSELIASHKLLEQGKSTVFLPLCLKS